MSIFDSEPVSQRRQDFIQDGMDAKTMLDTTTWTKTMFTSVESNIFENDNSETQSKSEISIIDPDLQKISQKVMSKVWDNKEDEFWTNY